ncbi:MAG: hypothetical protein ACKVQW_12230 [Pyrinomonadaceae bacterium]
MDQATACGRRCSQGRDINPDNHEIEPAAAAAQHEVAHTATNPQSDTVPGLLVQQNVTTFTASQTTNGVITEVVFTITENVYLVCDGCTGLDDLKIYSETKVGATNGPNAQNILNDTKLSLAANVVAEIVAESTAQGVDSAVTLGMAQKESFFGTVSGGQIPEMQSHINPLKLTRNQFADGTQPSSTDMRHNVRNAIRLFKDDKMAGGRTLAEGLFRYGPGNAQDPNYVSRVMGYSNQIRASSSTASSNPYTFHMVTIDRR